MVVLCTSKFSFQLCYMCLHVLFLLPFAFTQKSTSKIPAIASLDDIESALISHRTDMANLYGAQE